uniref:Uncharacterized protein n=1 Tax=Fagus sylvatica TaxID=28930 RepID=A0A2N9F2A7_FAGSY
MVTSPTGSSPPSTTNSDWISPSTEFTQARSHQSSEILPDLERSRPDLEEISLD